MKHALLAVVLMPLPYTLNVTGEGPFYARAGVPSCVAAAREDLDRQRRLVELSCARDGGRLAPGQIVDTMVQGVHCTAVQPLTCDHPGAAPPAQFAADQAPRS